MSGSAAADAGTTRGQILAAADRLFHERGFERTSFADVAQAVGISRGNFYYHFRSKDEILAAVIARRRAATAAMLEQWQAGEAEPAARIRCFVHMLLANRAEIVAHGCPVGTLCAELARLDHAARGEANALFALFRDWLETQFTQLGADRELAGRQAMHLLARSQGVAALANALQDELFLREEVRQLERWLEECLVGLAQRNAAAPRAGRRRAKVMK